MDKVGAISWRTLSRLERSFIVLLLAYGIMFLVGRMPFWQSIVGMLVFLAGLAVLFQFARRGMRKAIWRLRNRLIAAYLFIAVVPIVLILALVGIGAWLVIGEMATYLVNTELQHREMGLMASAEALTRVPSADFDMVLNRVTMMARRSFPKVQVLVEGDREVRYPKDNQLIPPPDAWGRTSGLVLKKEGDSEDLYAWAHVVDNGQNVTLIAPVTEQTLTDLVPGLGDVVLVPLMNPPRISHVPPRQNIFDFSLEGYYQRKVPYWNSPRQHRDLFLLVDTRASAVLGIVFQTIDWAEVGLTVFVLVSVVFLIVELVSLVAGVQLSRSITGAVHELYEGTQHVKGGDFSYSIPVKGNDQLAELAKSFNSMTSNLGRLIVVAKEKERLESELTIAREVQQQLFPKDVPFTRTLELKGVCSPARMVSGDYYDFMALSDHSLAFAIGDVAGKGISAALLMATIQSTMRTQLGGPNGGTCQYSTASLVATLNRQLYANTAPEKYATFYFALYDDTSQSLTYTNAGHLSPMLFRGGGVQMLDSTGTVVGAFPSALYDEVTVPLHHGDLLVAYTDGVVEPENAYGEMFGEERLKDLVVKYVNADSSEIIARTMESVNQWTGTLELQDDMTMVLARRI
jgi:sigma-B regulation protein RsbU (phosphoserine phosphatase)